MAAGVGAPPDNIDARRVPTNPSPDIYSFNRKDFSPIFIEVGFCKNFGCHKKLNEKIKKYTPLVTKLQQY